jgi:hypothetical protein
MSAVISITQATSPMPAWSWDDLEAELLELTAGTHVQAIVPNVVSATRKQARFKDRRTILREVLCLTSAVLDDDFARRLRESGSDPLSAND